MGKRRITVGWASVDKLVLLQLNRVFISVFFLLEEYFILNNTTNELVIFRNGKGC